MTTTDTLIHRHLTRAIFALLTQKYATAQIEIHHALQLLSQIKPSSNTP